MSVGIGAKISTLDGQIVCLMAPWMTNHIIALEEGMNDFQLAWPGIRAQLTGGDYVLGIWLSIPRASYLVNCDRLGLFTVPSPDLYKTGVDLSYRTAGIVPLRVNVRRQPRD